MCQVAAVVRLADMPEPAPCSRTPAGRVPRGWGGTLLAPSLIDFPPPGHFARLADPLRGRHTLKTLRYDFSSSPTAACPPPRQHHPGSSSSRLRRSCVAGAGGAVCQRSPITGGRVRSSAWSIPLRIRRTLRRSLLFSERSPVYPPWSRSSCQWERAGTAFLARCGGVATPIIYGLDVAVPLSGFVARPVTDCSWQRWICWHSARSRPPLQASTGSPV